VGTSPEERHYIGLLGFFANARFLILDAAAAVAFLLRTILSLLYIIVPLLRLYSYLIFYYYYVYVFSTRNRIRDKVSAIIRHLQQLYSVVYTTRLGRDVNICLLFYRSNKWTTIYIIFYFMYMCIIDNDICTQIGRNDDFLSLSRQTIRLNCVS